MNAQAVEALAAENANKEEEKKEGEPIVFSVLIAMPRFAFGLFSQMFITMSLQYIAPTLSIELSNYGYTPDQIAVSYGIPAILYATTCPFIYLLTQKMKKRGVIVIGFVMISFANAMIGGSDSLFKFQKQPVFIFLGLCIIGISAGMVSIPVLPEMLEAVEQNREVADKYDMESIENYISGLFVSFQSLGEALGPMISSWIAENYGFTISQEAFSLILALFTLTYFFTCGTCAMFTADKIIIEEQDLEAVSQLLENPDEDPKQARGSYAHINNDTQSVDKYPVK